MVNLKTIFMSALCALSFGSAEIMAIVENPIQAYFWILRESCSKGCNSESASAMAAKKVNDAFACAILWHKFQMKKTDISMYEQYIRPMTCGNMWNSSNDWSCGRASGSMMSSMNRSYGMGECWNHMGATRGMVDHSEIKKFYWTNIKPLRNKICRLYKKWKMFNSFMLRHKQKMIMRQYFQSQNKSCFQSQNQSSIECTGMNNCW